MRAPIFLTLAEVLVVHADQLRRHGGRAGVRDVGLLESALAQPEASFGGEWLHRDLWAMAAAYAYGVCRNHPFVDGNKRTALACALVFLELNGMALRDPHHSLGDAMWKVAAGTLSKDALAETLRRSR